MAAIKQEVENILLQVKVELTEDDTVAEMENDTSVDYPAVDTVVDYKPDNTTVDYQADNHTVDYTTESTDPLKIEKSEHFENSPSNSNQSEPMPRLTRNNFEMAYLNHTEMEDVIEFERVNFYNGKYIFKCDECKLGYKQSIDFKRHKTFKHMKSEPPHTCLECKQVLLTLQDLDHHWRQKHTAVYKCKICLKMYRTSRLLRLHLSIHGPQASNRETMKGQFPCPECSKMFKHYAGLLNHKLDVHENTKAFQCPACGYSCRWKSNLKRHMEQHAVKDKPPEAYCSPCDVTFATACSYQRHLRTSLKHVTDDQHKYVCGYCVRHFPNKTSLTDHIGEVHMKDTYQCPECNEEFEDRTRIRQHIKRAHRDCPVEYNPHSEGHK